MNQKTIRTLHPEVRVISEKDGTVDYIASDETLDQYREIVLARGWRFDFFQKNAPFVDSHDYGQIERLLGRVTEFGVKGSHLVERVKYALDVPSCTLAKFAFDMVAKGYLRAVSVGFTVEAVAYRNDPGFAKLCEELKLDTAAAQNLRCIYTQHQQIELSQCIIGANPNALARAFKDGAATEEQMAAIGFADADAMEFLQVSAAASEKPEFQGFMESLYRLECRRLFNLSSSVARRGSSPTDPSPGSRAGGDGSKQREQEEASRTEFLRKLRSVAGL